MSRVHVVKDVAAEFWQEVEFRGESIQGYEYSLRGRSLLWSKKKKHFICEANKDCLFRSCKNPFWNCWHIKTVAKAIKERGGFQWEIQKRLEK